MRYLRRIIKIPATASPNVRYGLAQQALGIEPTNEIQTPGVLTYEEYVNRLRTWEKDRQCVGLLAEFFEGPANLLFPIDWRQRAAELARDLRGARWTAEAIGCLPEGEEVLTKGGKKTVESIGTGEFLINKSGGTCQVVKVYRRKFTGEVVLIKPAHAFRGVKFTDEHPILVLKDPSVRHSYAGNTHVRYRDPETVWKRAGQVRVGDILKYPVGRDYPTPPSGTLLGDWLEDDRFWFIAGLWVADGWISGNRVCFGLNTTTKSEAAKRVKEFGEEAWGRQSYQRERPDNSLEVSFTHPEFAKFLGSTFGLGAHRKHLAEWVKGLPLKAKLAFFSGYLRGDGSITFDKGNPTIELVSVSRKLLEDFQEILLSLGFTASLTLLRREKIGEVCGRKATQRETYHLRLSARDTTELLRRLGQETSGSGFSRKKHCASSWIEDGFLYVKVASVKVERFSGFVYNFETTSHDYCCQFMAVHNCDPAEGGDRSSWAITGKISSGGRSYRGLLALISLSTPDTTVVTSRTIAMIREYKVKPERVLFDRGGGGKEHADRLRLQDWPVNSIGFGETVTQELRRRPAMYSERTEVQEERYVYKNRRAQMYHELSLDTDFIIPEELGNMADPGRKSLFAQLEVMPRLTDEEGRYYMLPKNAKPSQRKAGGLPENEEGTLVGILGQSPDEADAVVLAHHAMTHGASRRGVAGAAW